MSQLKSGGARLLLRAKPNKLVMIHLTYSRRRGETLPKFRKAGSWAAILAWCAEHNCVPNLTGYMLEDVLILPPSLLWSAHSCYNKLIKHSISRGLAPDTTLQYILHLFYGHLLLKHMWELSGSLNLKQRIIVNMHPAHCLLVGDYVE